MAKFLVQKSAPLHGEVKISGSKNAVLPIMAAALLTEEKCEIKDVPALRDVQVMCKLLESLGATVDPELDENNVDITAGSVLTYEAPYELHLKGLKALGATIDEERLARGIVDAKADKLKGTTIYLDFPSVGATEVIIMAASLAEGTTVLENAAQEPETVGLANFLNKMGARIKGVGTDTIKIEGVEKLKGVSHHVIPDRIEAGTFMVGAVMTKGNVLIKNVVPDHLKAVIAKLRECGADITMTDEGLVARGDVNPIVSTDVKTLPYPGFPTDMQSPFMALLTVAKGPSVVIETVFENRFMHVGEFNRMGANIKTDGNCAIIPGDKELQGAQVVATDLRAGAAVVLTGLIAEGTTEISQIYHVDRGYEHFVEKLRNLGANIMRVEE